MSPGVPLGEAVPHEIENHPVMRSIRRTKAWYSAPFFAVGAPALALVVVLDSRMAASLQGTWHGWHALAQFSNAYLVFYTGTLPAFGSRAWA